MACNLVAVRLQMEGRFEDANAVIRKSLEYDAEQGSAYLRYVYHNRITELDRPLIERMEGIAAEGRLEPEQMGSLHYALGRAYESLGEYEQALSQFDAANRIMRTLRFGDREFDRQGYAKRIDGLIDTFDRNFIERHRDRGVPSDLPVLIVGMMRSGTTLAEQILSSHAQIGAAGEQLFWRFAWPHIFGPESADGGSANRLPADGKSTESLVALLPELGAQYVDLLREIAPKASRVTDKLPANFMILGPIHIALPHARIVHMRRNPIDTCLSIFTTPNAGVVNFAHDRDDLVFAYGQYLRLMAHWRSVLPPDWFVEVDYEDVVADREPQIRRMLDVIGLGWDDAVMRHEDNDRIVVTPSLWQVRQPIYTGSVERWRHYEPWLGAFGQLRTPDLRP